MVTVSLDEEGRGNVLICCEETGKPGSVRYDVDIMDQGLRFFSRHDLLYQVCRRAISQFQRKARAFRTGDRTDALNWTIAPWNGDLYDTPPLIFVLSNRLNGGDIVLQASMGKGVSLGKVLRTALNPVDR